MVRLKDIAEEAGVSLSAVSRVLNNKNSLVSEDTKKRVHAIARKLNYIPNHFARSLKTGKTRVIGVTSGTGIPIKGMFNDPYFSQLFAGIGNTAADHEYRVLFQQNREALPVEESIAMARSNMTDGIIFILLSEYLDDFNKNQLPRLQELNVPFSVIVTLRHTFDVPAVGVNTRQGGYLATQHLLEHGYRDVGIVTLQNGNPYDAELTAGYRRAMLESGIQATEDRIINSIGMYASSGYTIAGKLIENGNLPRAVFIGRTEIARGFHLRLLEEGIKVPDECALTAYGIMTRDDRAVSPITTVRQPAFEAGQSAAEMLFEAVDGGQPENRILCGTLEVRRTCGCK